MPMIPHEILEPMDIIFTRSSGLISWWIRWRTLSSWSHVCLVGEVDPIHAMVYTTSNGITVGPFKAGDGYEAHLLEEYLRGQTWAICRVNQGLTDKQKESGLLLNHENLGVDYDYMGFITMELSNFKGQGVQDDGTAKRKCSETVAWMYRMIGAPLTPHLRKPDGALTPGDIFASPFLRVVVTNDAKLAPFAQYQL